MMNTEPKFQEIGELRSKLKAAMKQRDEAVAVLREVARGRPLYCVCCGADTWDNHRPDCRLDKLLREVGK